jgi:protein-S-isoprenylcysteine O-methyltransferase Ste14
MKTRNTLFGSAVLVYFIIAFEVLIMISPFAGFFYAVFNPVLLQVASHPATRWLSAFYLPHMVLPGNGLLVFIRLLGSVLTVLGLVVFLVCALQIYTAKLFRRGAVAGGLYAWIRHPQYLALAVTGIGLSILWPRILNAVLWLVMVLIYVLLAKDEERRMRSAYPDAYGSYMDRTGRFLPAGLERLLTPATRPGRILGALVFVAVVLVAPFLLRAYTVRHLTLWTGAADEAVLAILPEDGFMMENRMAAVLALDPIHSRMQPGKPYLAYFLPRAYIMQGMIADTGGDWKLFEQHRTFGMIADWVFNPFGHLRGGHHGRHAMHTGMAMPGAGGADEAMTRRLIFIGIEGVPVTSPSDLFAINAVRKPAFMVDVDVHNLKILEVKDLAPGSGWGTVPTPVF